VEIIVQKYGGSSLATPEQLKAIAQGIAQRVQAGKALVVVVSAMGRSTDELLHLAGQVTAGNHRREMDMLLSTGERISMALLSMAIADLGVEAISFTGSQCGIITNDSHSNARIIEVRPVRVEDELAKGRVVIVAGYQGMSYKREITTLGRGGSDTTALALAAALHAESCEIYSDVPGVFSADPKKVLSAQKIDEASYDELLTLARHGAQVLRDEAIAYAKAHRIKFTARKTGSQESGTAVGTRAGLRAVTSSEKRLFGAGCKAQDLSPPLLRSLVYAGADGLLLASDNLHGATPKNFVPVQTLSWVGQGLVDDPEAISAFLKMTEGRQAFWTETLGLHARFDKAFDLKRLLVLAHDRLVGDANEAPK